MQTEMSKIIKAFFDARKLSAYGHCINPHNENEIVCFVRMRFVTIQYVFNAQTGEYINNFEV